LHRPVVYDIGLQISTRQRRTATAGGKTQSIFAPTILTISAVAARIPRAATREFIGREDVGLEAADTADALGHRGIGEQRVWPRAGAPSPGRAAAGANARATA